MEDMMQDWLAQRAARSPERAALLYRERQWTFRQLDARVNGAARVLLRSGIGQDTRVAVLMGNSDMFAVVVHALARIGAVLVPLNSRLTTSELAWQVSHLGLRFLIADESNRDLAELVSSAAGQVALIEAQTLDTQDETAPLDAHFSMDAPHSILFTSGTTGRPKGAVLTYASHWWNAMGSALNLGLHADDVWLACMPLFHVGGLAILLRGVIYGAPVIVHPDFDAGAVNRAFDQQKVTLVSLVSTMLQRVLDARGTRPFPPSLRCILLGGGPAPRELLERCARLNVPAVQTFGLTEAASQVATLAPSEALEKLGSAGKPLMGIELKIEGISGVEGGVGEVVLRGGSLMREYADDPAANATAFREGWFHTGDLGYRDDDGYLYVVSRREDLIVSGGENIYPAEVEAVLNGHPAVRECAVVGVDSEEWVQVPNAYVVLHAGATVGEEELMTHCAGKLARYKIPKKFLFVSSLPRTASGKLIRRGLVGEWEV